MSAERRGVLRLAGFDVAVCCALCHQAAPCTLRRCSPMLLTMLRTRRCSEDHAAAKGGSGMARRTKCPLVCVSSDGGASASPEQVTRVCGGARGREQKGDRGGARVGSDPRRRRSGLRLSTTTNLFEAYLHTKHIRENMLGHGPCPCFPSNALRSRSLVFAIQVQFVPPLGCDSGPFLLLSLPHIPGDRGPQGLCCAREAPRAHAHTSSAETRQHGGKTSARYALLT